jgi:simple sugar transport system substrate-binding protein
MDQGCDILTQHTDSPAPLQAAASRGIKAFGQSSDMLNFAPTTQLTATTDNWGPYYQERIEAVLKGTWKSTDTWGGFKSGMLAMSPFTNMSPELVAMATQAEADIKSGKKQVWLGPVYDQAGAEKIAAGKVPDDGALNGMQWLAKGIEGKLT